LSSARKRSAIGRANREIDYLRQKLILTEHHASCMETFAKIAAQKSDALYAVLAELVALEQMRQELSLMLLREEGGMGEDYDRRLPKAWARAQELVGPNWMAALQTPAKWCSYCQKDTHTDEECDKSSADPLDGRGFADKMYIPPTP
jgi:hypothetical protein